MRLKQTVTPTVITREDAEAAMNDLALAVNNQRKLIAKRDQYILEVNERYAADLADLDQAVQRHTTNLRAWAESNPAQFPKDRKSITLAAGTIGFRTGTPKLVLLSRAFTWEKVLRLLEDSCMGAGFIRTKREVDKERLLGAHSARSLNSEQLATAGVKVTQEETFFAEPDLTKLETRQTN